MKRNLILILGILFSFLTNAQDETRLFRNKLSADRVHAGVIVLNGDSIVSVGPSEGQAIVFSGGKYKNSALPALSADSMIFDTGSGILRIYRNGFAIINSSLDGRYLLIPDADNLYLKKSIYDPDQIGEQVVGLTASQTVSNKTFIDPEIQTFIKSQHDHSSPEQGGPVNRFIYAVNMPAAGSVTERLSGATVSMGDSIITTGWSLAASEGVDLSVTHPWSSHKVAFVNVWEIDGTTERLARPFSDGYAGIRVSGNVLVIEGLDTILQPLRIEIFFN